MEKKSPSIFFTKLLQGLSNKSSNLRYTSKYSLQKICSANPSIFFTEFNYYFKEVKILEPKPLIEFATALTNVPPNDDTFLSQLHSSLLNIENICKSLESVTATSEIISIATNFFNLKPNLLPLLANPSKKLQIMTTLAVSQMITTGNENIAKKYYPILLGANCESNYHHFARARLITSITMFPDLIPTELNDSIQKSSEAIFDLFCQDPQQVFAPFLSTLVKFYPPSKEKHKAIFLKLIELISKNSALTVYLVPSATALSDHSEEQAITLCESLIPSLSITPFHFSSTLPDDSSVNGFNASIRAISTFITPETKKKLTNFFINCTINGETEQRLGFHYALTCLINLGAELEFQEIKKCFHRVSTPLEAGTLAELALALLTSGHQIMTWNDMVMLFEDCFSASNSISEQFVIEASSLLGKHINSSVEDALTFFSHCVYERFKFAQVHFAMLNTYYTQNSIKISDFPPLLTMHMLLFIKYYPEIAAKLLNNILQVIGNVDDFLETLDPNVHSVALRAMLDRFGNNEQCRNITFNFIISLTSRCSKQEAGLNVTKVMEIIGGNVEKMIDIVSSIYAAFTYVDYHLALPSLQSVISNQTRGWFLFGSSAKSETSINLVFQTLSKLKSQITPFIQFATDHLPDISNVEQCQEIIKILAQVLRNCAEIQSEFPPKCILFDFVMSLKLPPSDDIYRCTGELIAISPIFQTEHIPYAVNLILSATEISDDLMFLLKRTLQIAETPGDIQLLIGPFVQKSTDGIAFKMLLSILEALVGDQHENNDFPSLHVDASSKLDNFDGNFDRFLSLIAKIIGYYVPIFEKSHIAVEYTLRIMGRLTKKIEVRTHLPLQEAVHCVALSFNSQCILDAAMLFCDNFTIASITSFLILFSERENELLECANVFINKIFMEKPDSAALVFDSNETLAKAATVMLETKHLPILKNVLKTSNFKKQIIDTLLDYVLTKYEMIVQMVEDPEYKDVFDQSLPEVQYALTLCDESHDVDVSSWTIQQSTKFVELVKNSINSMNPTTQAKFAKQIAKINYEDIAPLCISLFESSFKSQNLADVMPFVDPFARSQVMAPVLLRSLPDGKVFRAALTITLSKPTTLALIFPQIPPVLEWILKHEKIVKVTRKQKDVSLLKPYLPLIIWKSWCQGQLQEEICQLISAISGTEVVPPTSFIGLFEMCSQMKFCEPDAECVVNLMKKARHGDFIALIVLCILATKQLLEKENYKEAQSIASNLLQKETEESQITAFLCLSCFPIQSI